MTASEVRQAGSHASRAVIDAAAEIANKAQDGAAAALATARVTADEVGTRLPGIASAGVEGAAESVRMLQELADPRLELLAAFSLGVGTGLWLAGAPRLVTLVALSPALLVGVAIASRKQSQQGRGRRR
ncbi:MAG TPA: hypothetical protein VIM30_10405 [Candidatus Limnocylindrales bacterium]|jgi:hypothetical protein